MGEARLKKQAPPKGWQRFLFRTPIYLYRWNLGFLLGKRFVLLEHAGRITGKTRSTVLEVVETKGSDVYIAAAWGEASDWYRNTRADPHVVFQLGNTRSDAIARPVGKKEAKAVFSEYAEKHPSTFSRLAAFMLDDPGESLNDSVEKVSAVVPLVVISPE